MKIGIQDIVNFKKIGYSGVLFGDFVEIYITDKLHEIPNYASGVNCNGCTGARV